MKYCVCMIVGLMRRDQTRGSVAAGGEAGGIVLRMYCGLGAEKIIILRPVARLFNISFIISE